MKYSVKWVEDNLGITRKAIRNYEANGLLPLKEMRNPNNNYREFDDDGISCLWSIKVLQGIGYSVKEIKRIFEETDFDFHASISEKVEELKKKRKELDQLIEMATTIRVTGHIPTVKQVGSMRYEDYIKSVRESWSLGSTPFESALMEGLEFVSEADENTLKQMDYEKLGSFIDTISKILKPTLLGEYFAYCNVLSGLSSMDHKDKVPQTVVELLFNTIQESLLFLDDDTPADNITPQFFSRYLSSMFMKGSDLYLSNVQRYGEYNCRFIAKAIAYFGDYDISELLDE